MENDQNHSEEEITHPDFTTDVEDSDLENDNSGIVPPVMSLIANNQFQLQNALAQVTTEGVSAHEMAELQLENSKNELKQCSFCNKFFKQDMLVPVFENKNEDAQCWHCLYWMNYSINTRKQVDGAYGLSIVEYIIKCKDIHEMDLCTRNTDSGGCFLCEFNLGLPITDVKDLYKLKDPSSVIPDNPIDDFEDMIDIEDSYKSNVMTIEI